MKKETNEVLSADEYFESGTDIQKRQWKTMPMYFAESYAQYREQLYLKSKLNEVTESDIDNLTRQNSREDFFEYGTKAKFRKGIECILNYLKKN